MVAISYTLILTIYHDIILFPTLRRLPTLDLLYIDLTVIVAFLELRGQSQLKLVLTSSRRRLTPL